MTHDLINANCIKMDFFYWKVGLAAFVLLMINEQRCLNIHGWWFFYMMLVCKKYIWSFIIIVNIAVLTLWKKRIWIIFDQIHQIQGSNTNADLLKNQIQKRKIQIQIRIWPHHVGRPQWWHTHSHQTMPKTRSIILVCFFHTEHGKQVPKSWKFHLGPTWETSE